MVLIMAISNAGYLFLILSTNLTEALLATKIVYLGGCFLPVLYFFTVCEICHFEINKVVKLVLILFQLFLMTIIATAGYTNLYYKAINFYTQNGIGYLKKEYGQAHFLYPLTLYGYLCASLAVTFFVGLKRATVNRKEIFRMLFCAGVAAFFYVVQRILKLNMDIMPFSCIVMMVGALIPIYHSNLYTANENKNIVNEQLDKIGFITFNNKMEYMGSNDNAKHIFPELSRCKVGKTITECTRDLSDIIRTIEDYDLKLKAQYKNRSVSAHSHIKNTQSLKLNDEYFETEIHTINNYRNKNVGYTIEFKNVTEHYRIVELTSKYNDNLTKEVTEKTERIRAIQGKTILGMAQMVESRDLSTGGHIKRTSDVVRIFSDKLIVTNSEFKKDFLDLVVRSAPMHDLGKIGVNDSILRKNGRFTEDEYEQMKKHAEIGGKMVEDILTDVEEQTFVQVAKNVANYHHEKVNGKGYPEGLKEQEIPVEARIMALADVFDALVSKRCYKEAFSYDEAFAIIAEEAGSHFDSELTKVFLTCRPELESYYNHC